MEYLFITNFQNFDWEAAVTLNANSDICISSESIKDILDTEYIASIRNVDIVHAGLFFFKLDNFKPLMAASLNWHFLDPNFSKKVVSWKASLHVMIIKCGFLSKVTITDFYTNPHLVAADIGYQAMQGGAIILHDPSVLKNFDFHLPQIKINRYDQMQFIQRHMGSKALALISPVSYLVGIYQNQTHVRRHQIYGTSLIKVAELVKVIKDYSAIIPTIKRYDYLKKAIYSLLNNARPPAEIVIVDQTPVKDRIEGYYDEFDPDVVKVHFQDKAGQCSSRNYAIMQCKYEWILFFDDDSEAWPEMISEHIWLLEHSHADASTGMSLAPWKDRSYIDESLDYYHLSSVLDTGNSIIRKSAVESIGMFDTAFDRGSGADDNLGKRLYLNGSVILFNSKAIRTHYKASEGGLREHGAWWKNKGTFFGPLPLPTESYNFLTFYPRDYYFKLCLYKLITSYRRSTFLQNIANTLLFPVKLFNSYTKAKVLLFGK